MARKNSLQPTKYQCIKELTMADGSKNYIAVFNYLGTRYGEKNLSKLFGAKTAKSASEILHKIKTDLSNGIDVFGTKSEKVDSLVYANLKNKAESYRSRSTFAYNKHAKPIIGHLMISKVTKGHLTKIRENMEALGLSQSTIKTVKTILTPIFKEAHSDLIIKKNVLEQVKMGRKTFKPPLTDRVGEPLIDAIRKIYQSALKYEKDYSSMFLISIMCARRIGEIRQLKYEDIEDGIVNVRAGTTKTYKELHPESTVERYPLPKEVLDIIGTGKGNIFTHYKRTYSDKYAKMIDLHTKLKLKPLSKEYPIRSHDNRNFLISLQSKKYGRDFVGTVCLSHSNKQADMNALYFSAEFQDVVEVFEDYWEKLRAQPTKTFVQNAIEEQLKELSIESEVN
jgi:integrase